MSLKSFPSLHKKIRVKDLVGDLTYREIKMRRWRIPRLWKDGKKLLFVDYLISEDGIIIVSKKRKFKISRGRTYTFKYDQGSIIPLTCSKRGYVLVDLCLDLVNSMNKISLIKVHRLMYETWIGRIPEGLEINHKYGIKSNNDLEDLEVVTHKENIHHAIKSGLNWTKKQRNIISSLHKGRVLSEEHKRKIGKSLRGKGLGRIFSLDHRKKISEAAKKRTGEKNPNSRLTQKQVDKLRYLKFKENLSVFEMMETEVGKMVSKSTIERVIYGCTWNPEKLTRKELMKKYGT